MRLFILCCVLLSACDGRPHQFASSPQPAQRIVTLAPNLTELVFSAGAGSQLVATVEYSDYPAEAQRLPRVGSAFRLDEERLLALKPDMVLSWISGTPKAQVQRLRELGMQVVEIDVSQLDSIPAALRHIGMLTGHAPTAERAAQDFEERIQALRSRYQQQTPVSVFVEVDRAPLFTVNGQHLITAILQLCGGRNVFADLPALAMAVSLESVLQRNPQVIIAATRDRPALQNEWSAWMSIDAVHEQQLYAIDQDLLTRGSVRVLQAAEQVCDALHIARTRSRNNH